VSIDLLSNKVNQSKLSGLVDLNELINMHKHDLKSFLTQDSRGTLLPDYIAILAREWQTEREENLYEIKCLEDNIQYIKNIIAEQEDLSKIPGLAQITAVDSTIDEAFSFVNFNIEKDNIIVKKEYERIKPIIVDRGKLLQILIKLITNAKGSLLASLNQNKQLSVKLKIHDEDKDQIIIKIEDNGIGLSSENLAMIFSQGCTSKKNGNFILHSSINAAKEMGGDITAVSAGEHQGTTMTLRLPYKVPI
jgi:C4-dicarboxylate-specific signal transduction histidine kinase